jgi:serine/threonine-protein kinase
MSSEPADRPASAGELAEALERGLARERAGPTLLTPRVSHVRRGAPRWLPAAAAVAALALLGGGAFFALGGDGEGDRGGGQEAGNQAAAEKPGSEKPKSKKPKSEGPAKQPKPDSEAAGGVAATPAPSGGQVAGDPATLNARGFALINQGRYDEAIPPLQRAVESYDAGSRDLTYAYALFNLGRALRLAGRPTEAIPILERRLRIPNQTKTVEQELKRAQKAAS